MYENGDFSWKKFFLGFLTRKFLIAVGVQIVATFLAYYAFDIVMKTTTTGKGGVDSKTINSIYDTWCYFTIGNASAFGLFNSTSKFASNSLQKIKSGISGVSGVLGVEKPVSKPTSNVQPPPDQRDY